MNNFECRLEKKVSKNDKEYYVLIIQLTDTYEKRVFLDDAELEIIKLSGLDY